MYGHPSLVKEHARIYRPVGPVRRFLRRLAAALFRIPFHGSTPRISKERCEVSK